MQTYQVRFDTYLPSIVQIVYEFLQQSLDQLTSPIKCADFQKCNAHGKKFESKPPKTAIFS